MKKYICDRCNLEVEMVDRGMYQDYPAHTMNIAKNHKDPRKSENFGADLCSDCYLFFKKQIGA